LIKARVRRVKDVGRLRLQETKVDCFRRIQHDVALGSVTKPAVSHVHTKMVTPAEVDYWLKDVIKRLELCVGFVRAEIRAEVRGGTG
jgi:hypothetical protein